MTTKIHAGELKAEEAQQLLAAEGVAISECVLTHKAKKAPGKSPVKAGQTRLLSEETESEIQTEVAYFRRTYILDHVVGEPEAGPGSWDAAADHQPTPCPRGALGPARARD